MSQEKILKLEDKLFLVRTKPDKISHITVDQAKCDACSRKICVVLCPSGTYKEENGKLLATFENCLECGTCQIACPQAIRWENPRGGFGVTFRNG
jgi:ferredoxin like protein